MSLHQNQPDVISYNSAISACGKTGEWQAALHLFPDGDGTMGRRAYGFSGHGHGKFHH